MIFKDLKKTQLSSQCFCEEKKNTKKIPNGCFLDGEGAIIRGFSLFAGGLGA
jgi:hypothetical protein